MAKKPNLTKPKAYTYVTSEVEASYRIKMNPDPEKYAAIKEKITANGGYCLNKEKTVDSKCMCKKFLERDSEGWCKCHLYFKEARSEKDKERYLNSDFSVNEKKEKEIEKEMERADKLARKMEESDSEQDQDE